MTFRKIKFWNIPAMIKVSDILYKCGKNMAEKYDLHHWDNSRFKTWRIVLSCAKRNDIYLACNDKKTPVATFQTCKMEERYLFQKFATLPEFAGSGIGTLCINEIERLGKNESCKEVICEVYDKSAHAVSFYHHRGFTPYETVCYGEYNVIRMKKEI